PDVAWWSWDEWAEKWLRPARRWPVSMSVEEQAELEKVTEDLKNAESLPLTVEEQAELERLTRKFASAPNRSGDDAFFARLFVDMQRTGPFRAPQNTVISRILRAHGFDEKFTAEAHEGEDGKLTLIAYAATRVIVSMTVDERAHLERVRRDLHEALQDASGGTHEDIDVFEPELEFTARKYPKLRPRVKAFSQT